MFESIQFQNFKALRDTTLPLSRFTLIVGPNGSGKSTALQAFLALRNEIPVGQFQSAGVPNSTPVSLTGKSNEGGNNYSVTTTWAPGGQLRTFFPPDNKNP